MNGWHSLLKANDAVRRNMLDAEDAAWSGSPFEWIGSLPPRTKGAVGERLTREFFHAAGHAVAPATNTGHDLRVAARPVEVKLSRLWRSGHYTWQQIRDQDYEFCFLLGLSPWQASAWLVPKQVLRSHSTPQHGGSAGTDTLWLTIDPGSVPSWMTEWGGSLDECLSVAMRLLHS